MKTITIGQARRLQLHAQGLLAPPRRRARPGDVAAAIARMQLLQIDTIHVVARSPYFVLFSRLGAYDARWLERALERGEIFETWAHEACFAPAEDYALHRAHLSERNHWAVRHARRMLEEKPKAMRALLAHVEGNGAVRSSDFERPEGERGQGGWWGWKDEKRFLEAWFVLGELMVARRERFMRVYDLTSRVRPDASSLALPSPDAVRAAFVERAVKALGVVPAWYVADYFRLKPRVTEAELAANPRLVPVAIRGFDAPGWVHADHADALDRAVAGRLRATHTTLLSPFDPIVWDRERASAMFDFDYRIECYTPAPKRQWGYFVLPILHRGDLVGRLDAKAHRADGVFEVRALYVERALDVMAVHAAIAECAAWHGTPRVEYGRIEPRERRKEFEAARKAHAAASRAHEKTGGPKSARVGVE